MGTVWVYSVGKAGLGWVFFVRWSPFVLVYIVSRVVYSYQTKLSIILTSPAWGSQWHPTVEHCRQKTDTKKCALYRIFVSFDRKKQWYNQRILVEISSSHQIPYCCAFLHKGLYSNKVTCNVYDIGALEFSVISQNMFFGLQVHVPKSAIIWYI